MNTAIPLYHHPYRFENSPRFFQSSLSDNTFDDEDQIPTVEEFSAVIDDYLNNLSPKKRDKALVDQHRYCLIQQVLRDPRNTAISTAQFRFWVKKMFQLQPGTLDLVCHDNKPVAMKEQIYDILVKAHREAHHGGRDKTSALVRKRFSWIPKELVARFVRHCPFCITRRNSGHNTSIISKGSYTPSLKEESESPKRPYYMYEKEDADLYARSPLFYPANFYYPPLGITSPVPVTANSNTAAVAAAAVALMRSPDLLSHHPYQQLNMPENAFNNSI